MDAATTPLEPSKLMETLGLEAKGFRSPTFIHYSRLDGKEARLLIRAIYEGPRPGWPLLERRTIFDVAQRSRERDFKTLRDKGVDSESNGLRAVPCLTDGKLEYPIRVTIRIALTSQPGACDDMLKATRTYSQLYANGYRPFELPIASWRTAEGIWDVLLDKGAVTLPVWWERHVQPQMHASESRWKIRTWRQKGEEWDGSVGVTAPINDSGEKHEEGELDPKQRTRFAGKEFIPDSHGSARHQDTSRQEHLGTPQSPRIPGTSANTPLIHHHETEKLETSQSEKEEWAARIRRQSEEMRANELIAGNTGGVPMLSTSGKQIGVDEDEEEAMIIDRGWLQAVNILIQLADIIRSLHERRLCMVVCRPEFFSVCESQPFAPRSDMPSDPQPISLQLTHLSVVAPMPGYEGGKIVGHVQSDFEGDKAVAIGPGSASAFTSFGSIGTQGDDDGWMVGEEEGLGALKGVLDEASILRHLRYIAPEAISSRKAIAATIDIFSWGMTAYELLKGKGQEGTESDSELPEFFRAIHLHSTRAMPPMTTLCPSMPPELSAVIKKALALDPEERYNNCCALLHDLHKVKQICEGHLRRQARRDFIVGHIDYQSRFSIPLGLLDREKEFGTLEEVYRLVKSTGISQVACCWGTSGSGKSKLLELWARQKETENAGQDCFVGWAKMDQHLVKPLSAFIPVFCSLLERVFSDPLESASDWRQRILDSLAVNANIFLALLPKEWRAILLDGQESEKMGSDMTEGIDWESWVKQFRTWSYGLLRLFASESRPLLVVIDDLQWMEKSERELWEELITSETRRLDHCFILFSFRTQDDAQPDLSDFTSRYMIKANPFSEATSSKMVYQCFHWDDVYHQLPESWMQLCAYLYKNTKGNPFDLGWALSTLVQDGDIYYDYARQEWQIQAAVLKASLERNSEDFAASVLNSLSQQARTVLCHLACLPSRGIDISLLSRLTGKNESAVRSILDNCASLGIVSVRNAKAQFVHDKPHSAALALIAAQDKPRLLVKIGRGLEGLSEEFEFVRADMLLSASESDLDALEPVEVARTTVKAARQAAASAALDLAASYLVRMENIWSFTVPEAWQLEPKLAMEYLTITAEVALGRKAAALAVPKIAAAYEIATVLSTKLDITIWLFKLQISAGKPDLAMQAFFSALRLVGYDSPAETQRYSSPPAIADDIRAIANAPQPADTNEARLATSLANLVGTAGPTFYSYEVDKGWRIMHFAIPIYLHNHSAARHPSVAYSWYIMAVLLAERGTESLKLVRAYMDLGETYNLSGNSLEAYAETAKAVMAYVVKSPLSSVDYSRSYEVCSVTKNYDLLSYVLGLDLSTQALSGESAWSLFMTGREIVSSFGDDLQPATRLLTAPWIQFGANLIDSTLLHNKNDLTSLNVLEGEYVSAQDAKNLIHQASFYTAVYAQASLLLGLLFRATPGDLRQRAQLVQDNRTGGAGTILGIFCSVLLSITSLTLEDPTDGAQLDYSYDWLKALAHNHDFQAISHMLIALEKIKAVRQGVMSWQEMLAELENALAYLEAAKSHLFAGFLCMQAEAAMPLVKNTVRLKRNYLQHAQLAFKAAGALNLVRSIETVLSELPQSALLLHTDERSIVTDMSNTTTSEGLLSHDISSSFSGSEEITSINGKEFDPQNQKLGLESILRSFLVLASERDSEGLIRRVLRVLLQITCSNYACFTVQDPATGSIMLKGYGPYENIKVCDVAISEAKDIAPTVLLSHASMTKKPIRFGNGPKASDATLLRREPFFASTGPPKTLLALPLFVQGRFSGLLFLSGNVANGQVSSQVGLLATFAAILLQSHQAYSSLESAVEMRTQQLQHALHSRSTFISGVSHEIRTPLFAITGLCSVMESSWDLTDAQRENLQVISQSADDLQRIVTAVLDWSKLDARSITPESIPFDLRNIVENAMETVAHLARSKKIKLLLENPVSTDPQKPLLGDPYRYRQCLLNLLSNAIKFTKPNESNHHDPVVSISWSWQDHSDKVEITCAVKDEGIGIPAKSMHRLFHSFSQVDSGISRNFGGTGLGGLARSLGGDCWAESVEGKGSTFYLLVTANKAKGAHAQHPKAYLPGPPRQARLYAPTCLASSVIQANLTQWGIRTEIVSVLDLCDTTTTPEFVLIDVDDPSINETTIKCLQTRHSGSKFVFLIPLTEVSKSVYDLQLKQEVIVTKPLKVQSLYNATRSLDPDSRSTGIKSTKRTSAMDSSYAQRYPLKICFTDDSSVNVAVGKKILARFGYKNVDVCYDGRQAVEAAERTRYDLMLMDLQMPNMDGHTARKLISENENCGSPMVVALTANCDQPTKDRCLEEGFSDFLTKPLIMSDLAKLLVRVYVERYGTRTALPLADL